MDVIEKETPNKNTVKADTSEVYEDTSVSRAKEICEELTSMDVESDAEKLTSRYNNAYVSNKNNSFPPPTYPSIKVNKDLVVRAIAGVLTEMRFTKEETMRIFPSCTPDYNAVRDLLLRKEIGQLNTEMILVDVKPYHPLQEFAVKERKGKIEMGSDEWKKTYSKSYQGYEGYVEAPRAKSYADEFDLDIEIKDGLKNKSEMNKWERREKKKEVFLHDLTS